MQSAVLSLFNYFQKCSNELWFKGCFLLEDLGTKPCTSLPLSLAAKSQGRYNDQTLDCSFLRDMISFQLFVFSQISVLIKCTSQQLLTVQSQETDYYKEMHNGAQGGVLANPTCCFPRTKGSFPPQACVLIGPYRL